MGGGMSRVRAGVIALMALVGGCSAGATPELNTVGTDGVIPTVATLGPNQGAPSSVDSTSKPAVTTTVLGRTAASEPGGAPSSKPLAARTIDARPEGQVVTLGLAPSVARALRELRELVVGFDAVLPILPIPKLNIYADNRIAMCRGLKEAAQAQTRPDPLPHDLFGAVRQRLAETVTEKVRLLLAENQVRP